MFSVLFDTQRSQWSDCSGFGCNWRWCFPFRSGRIRTRIHTIFGVRLINVQTPCWLLYPSCSAVFSICPENQGRRNRTGPFWWSVMIICFSLAQAKKKPTRAWIKSADGRYFSATAFPGQSFAPRSLRIGPTALFIPCAVGTTELSASAYALVFHHEPLGKRYMPFM